MKLTDELQAEVVAIARRNPGVQGVAVMDGFTERELRVTSTALAREAKRLARDGGRSADVRELALLADKCLTVAQGFATESVGNTCPATSPPMTPAQAAAALGYSAQWVRRIAHRLGGVRVGRSWMFDAAAVEAHRHQQQQQKREQNR